jgi:ferrochelatase
MSKQGVLLINLGSPDSTSVPDVRRYLREFLMDGRVIDVPFPIRWAIVHLAILPFRPKQSAHAYKEVWLPEGSPLVVTSRNVAKALQEKLGEEFPLELAMRYQNPSIESAVRKLKDRGVTDLLVVPLFPHYATSSFETAAVRAREVAVKIAPGMSVTVAPPYYNHPEYVAALVESARPHLREGFDHLLFSFHGIPERHLRKGDPTYCHCLKAPDCCNIPSPAHATCYRAQCFATVRAFVAEAGIPEGKYSVSFQSRLGSDPWLQPYTDKELERFGHEGVAKMLVICPAFVSDCLETLEEIAMQGKESFLEAGGKEFGMIPCMNEHPRWIEALEQMVRSSFSRGASNAQV